MKGNNTSLLETIEKIKSNKIKLEKFCATNNINELYKMCRENGYSDTLEKFQNEVEELSKMDLDLLDENSLDGIAGGTLNKNMTKALSIALSSLSLTSSAIPQAGAMLPTKTAQLKENKGMSLPKKNTGNVRYSNSRWSRSSFISILHERCG